MRRHCVPLPHLVDSVLKLHLCAPPHPAHSRSVIHREFEHNANVSAARTLMQQGLRTCKTDEQMWAQYLRMVSRLAKILEYQFGQT